MSSFDGKGPLLDLEANVVDLEQWTFSTCRRFAGSYAKSKTFILNQRLFWFQKVKQSVDAEVESLVKEVTKLYVEAVSGIRQIFAKRDDGMNEITNKFPPLLPN